MSGYIGSFERIELKYMVPAEKYDELIRRISEFAEVDSYGDTTIYNIYFDTEDDRLIRKSLEKPAYKEKLRLRTYEVPSNESPSFVEIKKKFDGVVYKRRISLPYEKSITHLVSGKSFSSDSKSFMDNLRTKNGNLEISISRSLTKQEEL